MPVLYRGSAVPKVEVFCKMHKQGKKAVRAKINNKRTSDYACVAKSFRTID